MGCPRKFACDWNDVLSYKTVKLVDIRSKRLGAVHYTIQFGVLLYVIVYSIIVTKGYTNSEPAYGDVSVDVSGTTLAVYETDDYDPSLANSTWDAIDCVEPLLERGATTIAVRALETYGQMTGVCTAVDVVDPDPAERCLTGNSCPALQSTAHGTTTGGCNNTYCELYAWCPQPDTKQAAAMLNTGNFLVYMQSDVIFPNNNKQMSNSECSSSDTTCVNGRKRVSGVNLFTLNEILGKAPKQVDKNGNALSYWSFSDVASTGAFIIVLVQWDCNLDSSTNCQPVLTFRRLDTQGFRYTQVDYYGQDGLYLRDIFSMNGIRIVFVVQGSGTYFSFVTLLKTFGSGISLVVVATLVVDFLAMNCMPRKESYYRAKVERRPKEHFTPRRGDYDGDDGPRAPPREVFGLSDPASREVFGLAQPPSPHGRDDADIELHDVAIVADGTHGHESLPVLVPAAPASLAVGPASGVGDGAVAALT